MMTNIKNMDDKISALARTIATVLAEQNKTLNGLAKSAFTYKGSVDTFEELPSDPNRGDVWSVNQEGLDGMDYVWTGTEWDALGQITFNEADNIVNLYNQTVNG